MKKIIFFIGSMKRGGAERVISILSNEYAKKGWDVSIALLLFNEVEYEIDNSINIVDLTYGDGSRISRVGKWISGIKKLVSDEKPDAIVSFACRINILVLLATLGIKTRKIISERNDPRYDGRGFIENALSRVLYKKADSVVFQTIQVASLFAGYKLKSSRIIPNPIEVSCHAHDMKPGKIVNVGRLTKQKNQKYLIDAFAEVVKQIPYAELYIYGEGELREELEGQIKDLNLLGKVILPGNVSDIHEQIADANVFVLSSDYEGLSNALLEAMMMGLPVVSTRCAGADEYIVNNKSGILVDMNSQEQLSQAITYVIIKKDDAIMMGKNASNSVSVCNIKTNLAIWSSVIENGNYEAGQ